ncbi:hypothetical protein PIB30_008105 [Stylosanthes scabra]|uniref:Uncharacterized protein n=1 Tax=Stylosanthes scabra TaxID=79078 RepID=A0ABU6X6A7_9FABA|nr:hypothetical protein [Stylosanthes scabra]
MKTIPKGESEGRERFQEEEETEELQLVSNGGWSLRTGHKSVTTATRRRTRRREGLLTTTLVDADGKVRLTASGGGLRLDLVRDGGGGHEWGCGGEHGAAEDQRLAKERMGRRWKSKIA